jgi:hypothetical protein
VSYSNLCKTLVPIDFRVFVLFHRNHFFGCDRLFAMTSKKRESRCDLISISKQLFFSLTLI